MPRPLRVEYPGAIYHLMSRSDHRETVFRDDTLRLREQTPMTRQWIAHRLGMGSASYISHLTAQQKDCRL